MTEQATADRRVELYLRGDTYGTYDRQQDVLEQIRALEATSFVDDTSVATSCDRIHTPEQSCRDDALDTYEEFREWAETNGYSLEPAFQRRQRSYIGSDVVHEVVVFPMASLAVYEGTDLQAVFPCSDEDGEVHFSVPDCLDALESGDEGWFEQFSPVPVDRAKPRLDTASTPV